MTIPRQIEENVYITVLGLHNNDAADDVTTDLKHSTMTSLLLFWQKMIDKRRPHSPLHKQRQQQQPPLH